MTIQEKLEEYDLFDQAITRHGILECIRDFEVLGYLSRVNFDLEVQYIFKGCIRVDYVVKVAPEHYSMEDRLLDLDQQDKPDYPQGFVWGAKYATVYPGWTFKQDTDELKIFEETYGLQFYQVHFETNAYNLTITFHDLDIRELKRIDKKNAL